MSFTYRKGWHVCFFEADRYRRQLPDLLCELVLPPGKLLSTPFHAASGDCGRITAHTEVTQILGKFGAREE
jgi:hypothetical protein